LKSSCIALEHLPTMICLTMLAWAGAANKTAPARRRQDRNTRSRKLVTLVLTPLVGSQKPAAP
jgi:hypothetical protein